MKRCATLLFLLPALGGCTHWGESNYLGFELPGFVDLLYEFQSGDQLLLGSPVCPRIDQVQRGDETDVLVQDEGEQLRDCFTETVDGPATLDANGCLVMTGPGEVSWELTPDTCGEQSERMRWTLVEPSPELALGLDEWRARFALAPEIDATLIGLADGRDPNELLEPTDAPRRVYAGATEVALLRLDDANGRVFWLADDVSLELGGSGFASVTPEGEYEWLDPGEVALQLEVGGTAQVQATLPGGEVRVSPQLIGVDPNEAASLDLVAIDSYLFADVRDAQGRRIHAAPIEWSVSEGALAITPGDLTIELRTPEYATYGGGNCLEGPTAGPETRHATVHAQLGPLTDSIEVAFVVEPPTDSIFGPPAPDDNCLYADGLEPPSNDPPSSDDDGNEPGCTCTSEPSSPTAPTLLGLGLLALLRRRRP